MQRCYCWHHWFVQHISLRYSEDKTPKPEALAKRHLPVLWNVRLFQEVCSLR